MHYIVEQLIRNERWLHGPAFFVEVRRKLAHAYHSPGAVRCTPGSEARDVSIHDFVPERSEFPCCALFPLGST